MGTVLQLRHRNPKAPGIDFDLLVDLMVIHHGMTRRDAEVWARKEIRRDGLHIVRSKCANDNLLGAPAESQKESQQ